MKKITLLAAVLLVVFLAFGTTKQNTGQGSALPTGLEKTAGSVTPKIAADTVEESLSGVLERTAGGHVIAFAPGGITFANGDHGLRLKFINPQAVFPESPGSGPSRGGQAAPLGMVVYRDLWPGVTLNYSAEKGSIAKSVWTVAPGAGVDSIRVRANVAVALDPAGSLVYAFPSGTMSESKPVAWQEVEGNRVPVEVTYRLLDEREFGFKTAACDSRYPLVIDPILNWNTFLGGSGDDSGNAIVLDSGGNIYVVGYSNATWGSPVRAFTANYDAFVAKLNSAGTLQWNTFLGGNMNDYGYGIGLDAGGNIYVSGLSNVGWGSPIRAYTSPPDEFVAKLNSSGALQWNTFLGGTGYDYNNGMTVDASGNTYAIGASDASWGTPVNPFVAIPAGYKDWSIAKVDNNGYLQWNTFLGGTANDTAFGVALDAYGGVYITGASRGTWGSPLNPYTGTGANDIAVAKINASDGVLQWNTFYGQAGQDYAYGISVSPEDIVLIAGWSDATWGTPINPYAGGSSDGYIAALDLTGAYLGHTFIGGPGDDGCASVSGDKSGSIYVCGYSTTAWGSPDKPYGGGISDGFVIRLGATGNFQALTFFGGSGGDGGNALALGANRDFYIAGASDATWGLSIRPFSSGADGFVFKSTFIPQALARHAVGDFDGDTQDEAAVDFGTLGVWLYNGGAWSQITPEDPEILAALDIDGNADDEIVGDFGDGGLNLWDSGNVTMLTGSDVEGLAVGDIDGNGDEEIIADFGSTGVWIYDLGGWVQLSAANPDFMTFAQLNTSGGQEIVADFGAIGMWIRLGTAWFQTSGVNADFFVCGDTDANGTSEIAGDFGATGLWLWNAGAWTQLSGVDLNYAIMADTDASGTAEIVGDFGTTGLWLWDSGGWTMLSGVREDYMISANVDADPAREVLVDFGPLGLWEYEAGAWIQLSGVNPDHMISGDFDGDGQAELMVDFAALGLWVYDGGAWTQVSNINPD